MLCCVGDLMILCVCLLCGKVWLGCFCWFWWIGGVLWKCGGDREE